MSVSFRNTWLYKMLLWIILVSSLLFGGSLAMKALVAPNILQMDDYVEYWAAGRLNATNGNPYDPDQLAPLQFSVGRIDGVPVMMWNPPWTLALVMPLSLLDYPLSRLLWFLFNLGILLLCADWIWAIYVRRPEKRWVAWLIALTFAPVLHVLKVGQISLILLLGVVGSLRYMQSERWFAAGAVAALIAIKPHLLYLFGIILLAWSLDRRCWSMLLGFAAALSIATVVAWAVNLSLLHQYLYAVFNYPPAQWATPTLGGALRMCLGIDRFGFQFLPTAFGLVWGALYWWRYCRHWDWVAQLPLLVLVSTVTAAYGWTYDYPILLPVVISGLVLLVQGERHKGKLILLLLYVVVNLVVAFSSRNQSWYWWLSSWILIWYWTTMRFGDFSGKVTQIKSTSNS